MNRLNKASSIGVTHSICFIFNWILVWNLDILLFLQVIKLSQLTSEPSRHNVTEHDCFQIIIVFSLWLGWVLWLPKLLWTAVFLLLSLGRSQWTGIFVGCLCLWYSTKWIHVILWVYLFFQILRSEILMNVEINSHLWTIWN